MTNPTGSILLRRGPTADRVAFTPLTGEIIFDSDTKEVFVGDGRTPGGIKVSLELPPQEPNPGKFLKTDGSELSWETVLAEANVGVSGVGLSKTVVPDPENPGQTTAIIGSNATSSNDPDTIVSRDASGDFSAGSITSTAINSTLTGALTAFIDVESIFEKCSLIASSPPAITPVDLATSAVVYYTSNSANAIILNIRGDASTSLDSVMSVGQSATLAVMVTCSNAAHYITTIRVDGTVSGVTTKWQGGAAPTSGNVSAVDVYSFTVIKTASAQFTVFASQTRFG